ncbi:hypothetical protein [Rickettsia endosymbiont of Urophora cardui]
MADGLYNTLLSSLYCFLASLFKTDWLCISGVSHLANNMLI